MAMTKELAMEAKQASILLSAKSKDEKNNALLAIAHALKSKLPEIIAANKADLELAQKSNLALPLLKRLKFDESKIDEVIKGIESLINLPEPIGETLSATELDKGLELYKVSCPIGVIGVIFESRPDALVSNFNTLFKKWKCITIKRWERGCKYKQDFSIHYCRSNN